MLDEVKKSGVPLAFNTKVVEITRYMGAAWMLLRDSVCCTGDNMSLTEPLFPNYVNCDQFHAGPIRAATRANPPHMVNHGICVTPRGERYIDEGQTYVFVAQNTPKRIPENRAFIILDSRVRNEPIFDLRFKRYEKAKAPIYKADTIVELARQCGLPEAMLAKTVKEFNEAVHAGKGSKINKKAEVLNRDGKAIPGLYAAGNAIGVLFYDNYLDVAAHRRRHPGPRRRLRSLRALEEGLMSVTEPQRTNARKSVLPTLGVPFGGLRSLFFMKEKKFDFHYVA